MKVKPPADRRKFTGVWDEIDYLYQKLLYWLYQREEAARARPYAKRLAQRLGKADPDHEAIFGEECWSLVYETRGDLRKAIEHRENEVRLIRRLHDISRDTPSEHLMLREYGYDDLSDRLDLLATLYHDSGELDKALTVLEESRQLCELKEIPFDGEDLLKEYSAEKAKRQDQQNGAAGVGGRKRASAGPQRIGLQAAVK